MAAVNLASVLVLILVSSELAESELLVRPKNQIPAAACATVEAEHEIQLQKLAEITKMLDERLENYDKRLRPGFLTSKLTVFLAIHVEGITHVDETDMELRLILYLRQGWTDPRLKLNNTDQNINEIPLPADLISKIWIPDTFFPQEKHTFLHDASVRNIAVAWYPNGTIFVSSRLTVTTACPMDLTNFPMDSQVCNLYAESYGYTTDEVEYRWATAVPPITFGKDSLALLSHFKLKAYRWSMESEDLYGNFQLMKWEFLFVRSIGYYIIALYIPAALLVTTASLAFFMHLDLVEERLGLGVTTVLAVTTLLLAVHSTSPKISYVKAMDLYIGFSFFMVFAALMQSVLISNLVSKGRQTSSRNNERQNQQDQTDPKAISLALVHQDESDSKMRRFGWKNLCRFKLKFGHNHGEWARKLDALGRVGFPAAFVLFNLVYWIYYLNANGSTISGNQTWHKRS